MSGTRLAYHRTEGAGPAVVFLSGYASDMTGSKAVALEQWARDAGRCFVRFDYRGCGASEGAFEEATLADWRDDAQAVVEQLTDGPVILVGSSMGGWLMLLLARLLGSRLHGLVGVAPAPDFTDWGFSQAEKMALLQHGRVERPSPYSDQPTLFTRAFWSSGEANRVTFSAIEIDAPVRLLQGQQDADVPWQRTLRLGELIRSADVQLTLIKDGDHRLSRPADLRLLVQAIESL